jgi:sugar lactone lactonase YvrE
LSGDYRARPDRLSRTRRPRVPPVVCLLATAWLGLSPRAPAQTIDTIVGGNVGDGGSALDAFLAQPGAAVADAQGNVYVADRGNHRVRRIDPSGTISTVVGIGTTGSTGDGGPGTLARINRPAALAFDRSGRLLILDEEDVCVRRWDPSTKVVTTAMGQCGSYGDPSSVHGAPATSPLFLSPEHIAVAPNGDVLVGDTGYVLKLSGGTVDLLAGDGSTDETPDGTPAASAHLGNTIDGLAVDSDGNVYVSHEARAQYELTQISAATSTTRLLAKGAFPVNPTPPSGDGGPAIAAAVVPQALAIRGGHELLLYDLLFATIRSIDLTALTIRTLIGGGDTTNEDVPGRSVEILLFDSFDISVDPSGNVLFGDYASRIRRWNAAQDRVRTIAALNDAIGDGRPAREATLIGPAGIAVDSAGRLAIAEPDRERIRIVGTDGNIDTLIGGGSSYLGTDPTLGPRDLSIFPYTVAFDRQNRLLFPDVYGLVIGRYDPVTGKVSVVAGSGNYGDTGDVAPATEASFEDPVAVATAPDGSFFILDDEAYKIRRVVPDGTITTVAGNGSETISGDGGLATQAGLGSSRTIALDGKGGLYFDSTDANTQGYLIRRVDLSSGVVTRFAGGGDLDGDGHKAIETRFDGVFSSLAFDAAGNLHAFLQFPQSLLVIDTSGVVHSLNPTPDQPYGYGFSGDGGPVANASFDGGSLALDAEGATYVSDTNNNRVRKVGACTAVAAPSLAAPATGAAGIPPASVTLSWSAVAGAFRYDVYLDTANPPARIVAADVASTSFQTAALLPGTTYAWRVVAKGDPYCPQASSAASAVRTFTTASLCAAPDAFSTQAPTDGATGVSASPTLTWTAAPGAASYDIYLGTDDPPPLLASGLTATTYTASSLTTGSTYSWRVVAHSACDASRTSTTARARFTVTGVCASPPAFTLLSPPDGSTGRPTAVTLTWSPVPGAASYDVYLGVGSPGAAPIASGLTGTAHLATGLTLGASYRWQVVAHAACDPARTSLAGPSAFTVSATCAPPATPEFELHPAGAVAVDQAYVVSWSAADGADTAAGAFYRVERSATSSFATVLDSLDTTARSASFTAKAAGTLYHRVTAFSACGAPSSPTAALAVVVSTDKPRLVFTRQPEPAVASIGDDLVTVTTTLEIKNVSRQDFVGSWNVIQPIPFFRPDELTLGLRAGESKTVTLSYTGVPTNAPGRFDGLLYVTSLQGDPLDVVPYASVALSVTQARGDAKPAFGTDTVAFPPTPASQDPPPIAVTLSNPGTTPMALGGEIGPEVWLKPDPGWNATPLAPGETRTITLRSERVFALAGGTFPHYTYFTVHTKDGRTARLLVRDETPADTDLCASRDRLAAGAPSLIVPSVVNAHSALGNTFVSKLAIGNLGSDDAVVDLYYTPDGASGFDCTRVLSKRLTVAAGDVLSLTDPLGVLFGVTGSGSVELRSPQIAQLSVKSSVDAAAASGGTFGFIMPAVPRGAGVAAGGAHVVNGLIWNASYRTNLILAETSGDDGATAKVTLYDASGGQLGSPKTVSVLPYGKTQLRLVDVSAANFDVASATIEGVSGRGRVQGLVTVIDNTNDDASTQLARAVGAAPASLRRGTRAQWERQPLAVREPPFVVPALVTGYASTRISGAPWTFQSSFSVTNATATTATITATYRPLERLAAGGAPIARTITIPPRGSLSWDNVLVDLFGIGAAEKSNGPLLIEGDTSRVVASSRVFSKTSSGSFGDAIPVLSVDTESGTGAGQVITLETEGLETSNVSSGPDARGVRSNLILVEVLGKPATVTIELWEKGDRKKPISSSTVSLAALDKQQLSPVFQGDTGTKDRTNVRVTVTADPASEGKVLALVTRVDNITADTKNLLLEPVGQATEPPSIGF